MKRILAFFRRASAPAEASPAPARSRGVGPERASEGHRLRQLYAQGKSEYRQGDLEAAAATFRGLVQIDPKNGGGWYYIGRALYQAGDSKGAVAALQKAVALSPDNPNAVTWLAKAHKRSGTLAPAAEPDRGVDLAPVPMPKSLPEEESKASAEVDGLYELAHQLDAAGDLEASLATWMRITKDRPRDPEPFVGAGRVLRKLNRQDRALRQFWSAILLDDPNRFAHREYAACLRAFGEAEPGPAKKALARGRDLAAHVKLADTLEQDGLEVVAADIHLGLFAITRRAEHCRSGVELLRASGQAAQAIDILARHIKNLPPVKWTYQLYADLCLQNGEGTQALSLLAEGIVQFPREKALLTRQARILAAAHRWEECAQTWAQIAELNPDAADARNRIADCYRRARNYDRAVEEYRKVLQFAPENEAALRGLSRCLRRMGSREEAITALETLVRLAPGNPANWDDLVYALARAERLPEALAVLGRASEALGSGAEVSRKLALTAERALLFEEAERILQQSLVTHPEAIELHAEQVRYFLRQGLIGEASRIVQTTPALKQTHGPLTAELAQISAVQRYLGHGKANFSTQIPEDLIQWVAARRQIGRDAGFVPGRVAILTTQLSAGGAERQAVITAMGLSGRTDQVESVSLNCISLDPAGGNAFYLPLLSGSPVQVTSPGAANADALAGRSELAAHRDFLPLLPEDLRYAVSVWLIELTRQRPEVVHAWQDFACVAGAIAAILAGVPKIVLSTRNTRPDNRYRRWKRYMQAAYLTFAKTDGLVLCNNSLSGAADYDDWLGFPSGTTAVVYNGVDFHALESNVVEGSRSAIRRKLKIPDEATVVGGVFRLTGEKRPLMWLDAVAIVAQRFTDAHFILCGGGTMRKEVDEKILELGLAGRVHAVGVQAPIAPWYRAMDMLLLASRKEGLPNVLLESQFLGTPVVASDVGGVREVMRPGLSGWAVPDATAESLADRLNWSLANKDWLTQASAAGREYVEANFSIGSMLTRTLQLYAMGSGKLPVVAAPRLAGARQ